MKTPEQIASQIVNGLSFSSNRMVNGRLVGEQHFAAQAIADAIKAERDQADKRVGIIRSALCDTVIALIGIENGRLQPRGRVALLAQREAKSALNEEAKLRQAANPALPRRF